MINAESRKELERSLTARVMGKGLIIKLFLLAFLFMFMFMFVSFFLLLLGFAS